MGQLQAAILDYLDRTGPRTNAAIYAVIREQRPIRPNTVAVTLARMASQGLIVRRGRGVYMRVAPPPATEQIIVAGVLDRLERDYGEALREILRRRGWRRTRGTQGD